MHTFGVLVLVSTLHLVFVWQRDAQLVRFESNDGAVAVLTRQHQ